MAIGHKSLIRRLEIPNKNLPKTPYIVLVQANKNHGICDITVGTMVTKKIENEYVGRDGQKFTKTFSREVFVESERLSDVLSTFQGRQYDDEEIISHLEDVIYTRLNIG